MYAASYDDEAHVKLLLAHPDIQVNLQDVRACVRACVCVFVGSCVRVFVWGIRMCTGLCAHARACGRVSMCVCARARV